MHESEDLHGSMTDFACIREGRMKNIERMGRSKGSRSCCNRLLIVLSCYLLASLDGVETQSVGELHLLRCFNHFGLEKVVRCMH